MRDKQLQARLHQDYFDDQHVAHASNELPDTTSGGPSFPLAMWVQALFGGWKLILLGAILASAVAAIALAVQPKKYVAEALVAPIFSTTQVQFEPRIKTLDGTDQPSASLSPERRQALLDLVNTGEVEHAVITQLNGSITSTPTQPGQIVGRVRGLQRPKSEMISIQAEADTPDDAVAITNAWAAGFVDLVNRVYAGSGRTSLDKVQRQRDDALAQYQQDQGALTSALQSNEQASLDRQIKDVEHQIAVLQSPYQSGAFDDRSPSGTGTDTGTSQQGAAASSGNSNTNLRPSSDQASRVDAETARSDYRLAEVRTLNGLAENLRRLDLSKQNISLLLSHLQSGQSSPADEAAIAVLKTQLVSMTNDLPQLQLQVNIAGGTDPSAELQRLQDSIDQARAQVAAEFNTRRAEFEAKSASQIATLEDQLRMLKSQSEAAQTDLKQLTLKRDLSWDTYTALARKVDEQTVAQSSGGQQVEVASRASVAVASTAKTPLIVGAAAVAGALVAAFVVVLPLISSLVGPYMFRRSDRRAIGLR